MSKAVQLTTLILPVHAASARSPKGLVYPKASKETCLNVASQQITAHLGAYFIFSATSTCDPILPDTF